MSDENYDDRRIIKRRRIHTLLTTGDDVKKNRLCNMIRIIKNYKLQCSAPGDEEKRGDIFGIIGSDLIIYMCNNFLNAREAVSFLLTCKQGFIILYACNKIRLKENLFSLPSLFDFGLINGNSIKHVITPNEMLRQSTFESPLVMNIYFNKDLRIFNLIEDLLVDEPKNNKIFNILWHHSFNAAVNNGNFSNVKRMTVRTMTRNIQFPPNIKYLNCIIYPCNLKKYDKLEELHFNYCKNTFFSQNYEHKHDAIGWDEDDIIDQVGFFEFPPVKIITGIPIFSSLAVNLISHTLVELKVEIVVQRNYAFMLSNLKKLTLKFVDKSDFHVPSYNAMRARKIQQSVLKLFVEEGNKSFICPQLIFLELIDYYPGDKMFIKHSLRSSPKLETFNFMSKRTAEYYFDFTECDMPNLKSVNVSEKVSMKFKHIEVNTKNIDFTNKYHVRYNLSCNSNIINCDLSSLIHLEIHLADYKPDECVFNLSSAVNLETLTIINNHEKVAHKRKNLFAFPEHTMKKITCYHNPINLKGAMTEEYHVKTTDNHLAKHFLSNSFFPKTTYIFFEHYFWMHFPSKKYSIQPTTKLEQLKELIAKIV